MLDPASRTAKAHIHANRRACTAISIRVIVSNPGVRCASAPCSVARYACFCCWHAWDGAAACCLRCRWQHAVAGASGSTAPAQLQHAAARRTHETGAASAPDSCSIAGWHCPLLGAPAAPTARGSAPRCRQLQLKPSPLPPAAARRLGALSPAPPAQPAAAPPRARAPRAASSTPLAARRRRPGG